MLMITFIITLGENNVVIAFGTLSSFLTYVVADHKFMHPGVERCVYQVLIRFYPWPGGNSASWGPWNPGFHSRRLNLQITSTSLILADEVFVQHGSVKACPGVVMCTPRSAERPGSIIPDQASIKEWTGRQDGERPTRGPTVRERVKCRMKASTRLGFTVLRIEISM